jgi:aryl sulfotransferase
MHRVNRVYQNHHLDSTRWEVFEPNDGDVVVTSAYKAGSTWTQQVVLMLLGGRPESLLELSQLSIWVDARFRRGTKADLAQRLRALPGRRLLKSHLPLDGLPIHPQVRYIVGGRDARDVFMSLLNHYGNYTDFAYATLNDREGLVGDPLPRCPDDPRALWRDWITRGWFPWESEGYPFWSNMHHTQSFWDRRDLQNLFFVHYNDLLADLDGEVRRIAQFINVAASDELIALTVEATTFSNVKKAVTETARLPRGGPQVFREGLETFFHKGTIGRWRGVLTDEDLELYEQAKRRVLSPECATWLEHGRVAWRNV